MKKGHDKTKGPKGRSDHLPDDGAQHLRRRRRDRPAGAGQTSMEQGRLAMCHAFDLKYKTKLAPMLPAGIYTIPEICQVGMTEQDCQKAGIPYVVGKDRYGRHGRGQIIGDTDGMIKLIFKPRAASCWAFT